MRIMYLRCTLRQISVMRCVPAAQRETAILNLADENGSDEAVQSDRRDSRGLQETCESRDWRIRDPTWRKRDPTWRKSDEIGEKANFVGEIFFIREHQMLSLEFELNDSLQDARASLSQHGRSGIFTQFVTYIYQGYPNHRKVMTWISIT